MKAVEKRLDALWSELVKLRAGNKCEVCKITRNLNSHHVYSRAKMSVRWQVINGYCLCVNHHIGVKFSAHKSPNDFAEWSKKDRGQSWFDLLSAQANTISKLHVFEKELLAKELKKEIDKYKKT
mgnify:CR=1 FL=1